MKQRVGLAALVDPAMAEEVLMKRVVMFRGKAVAEVESLPDAKATLGSTEKITGVRRVKARGTRGGASFRSYVANVGATRKVA